MVIMAISHKTEAAASKFKTLPAIDLEEEIRPRFFKYQRVEATFKEPLLVHTYAKAIALVAESARLAGLEEEKVLRYLMTLLWLRIKLVRRENVSAYPRDLRIPDFWLQYLSNIGIVKDATLGIELVPAMDTSFEPSSPDEMRETSLYFTRACDVLGSTETFPRDLSGDWDVMTLQVVDGFVCSHSSDVHPAASLLGSLVQFHQAKQCFIPLVSYGHLEAYQRYIYELA